MSNPATTENVWQELNQQLFAVLAMVTKSGESRSVGIVYVVRDRKLYIGTGEKTWKVRHIQANPNVSMTIPIPVRIPIAPWVKIPQKTITFTGTARIIPSKAASPDILQAIFRSGAEDQEQMKSMCLIEVTPEGDFLTYGIGVPLMKMRFPEIARGKAPVS